MDRPSRREPSRETRPETSGVSTAAPAAGTTACTHVLLVEDEVFDAELMSAQIQEGSEGPIQVHVTPTLADAAAFVEREPVEAILLDLALPDSRGMDTLTRMREAAPAAAIVVMTGNLDERLSLEAIEQGADAYLVKGEAEPALLVRTILYAVGRRKALHDLEEEAQLSEHRATHDGLTGLPNRMLFTDRLEQAMQTCFRTGRVVGLLFVDLDHFKEVNDTLGHAAGDALLQCTARRLADQVRSSDTVARLGGDEFVVLLTNVRRAGDVEGLAEKIRQALGLPLEIGERRLRPSASIGAAVGPRDGSTAEDLMAAADAAMYREKHADRSPAARAPQGASAAGGTGTAPRFEESRLELLYAPRFDLDAARVQGFDVRVRAQIASARPLSGRALFTFGEEHGFGDELWDALIRRLERDLTDHELLRRVGHISIPVVAGQVLRPGFERHIQEAVLAPPLHLELCIPDALFAHGCEGAVRALARVDRPEVSFVLEHEEGFDLALRALRQLRPSRVCLNLARLGDIERDALDEAALSALSGFFARLRIPWVVEGVERAEQAGRLFDLGCRQMRGPLFGEYVTAAALEAELEQAPGWAPKSD